MMDLEENGFGDSQELAKVAMLLRHTLKLLESNRTSGLMAIEENMSSY